MNSIIYHVGLTPPPKLDYGKFKICHHPVLKVEYESINAPEDIRDILHVNPVVLVMSKNAVIGLEKWLHRYDIDDTFFKGATFWTVGEKTHSFLKEALQISSSYPKIMTGDGLIDVLVQNNESRVLLISGSDPRKEFIQSFNVAKLNYFHFPVYTTQVLEASDLSIAFRDTATNFLVMTSPSCIHGLKKNLDIPDLSSLKTKIITIGPTTSEAIRQHSGRVFRESRMPDINFLYENLDDLIS